MLAYCSTDYKVLAYNCILSLKKVGVENVGVLSLDDEAVDFFVQRGIASYNVARISEGVPEDVQLGNTVVPNDLDLSRLKHKSWSSRWNSRSTIRWQHWMLRHYLALQVLKEGISVFQTDVDMVFVSNPYSWLDPAADLEGQVQTWPKRDSLNLGIGHVKASPGGLLHWETTNNMMRLLGGDPQSIENLMLLDPLISEIGTIESKPCRADHPRMLCVYKKSPMINYRIWPNEILPMGYHSKFIYPSTGDTDLSRTPLLGIHVHASKRDFQLGKTSLYMNYSKEHNIWFISKEDEMVLFNRTYLA